MQNKMKQSIGLAALALLTMTSCNKELFDKNTYDKVVDYQFNVDFVDANHDWRLTKSDTINFETPEYGVYRLQILTANPYVTTGAEVAAEAVCYGYKATMAYTIPITQNRLYVAALNNSGEYLGVASFTYGTKEMTLHKDDLTNGTTLNAPVKQTFTYCYVSTFPTPSDFDYNDMVLRITRSVPDPANASVVDLTVKLDAVGASEIYGAAIQLAGVKYDDISKVEIVSGEAMDKDYPLSRIFITNANTVFRGRSGEAVINLFECAQWAMSKKKNTQGDISVIRYNTSHEERENYSAIVDPVTTTYRITFKSSSVANLLTFDGIDPFIVHQNTNGGIWEVHTYAHKFDETIWSCFNGYQSAYDNHISWSLVIPYADFRYAIEGSPLSSFDSNISSTFGPYEGFADWMKNHLTSRDWYLHLTRPQLVY